MEYVNYTRKKIICTNCGRPGHEFKFCNEPITSYGIINIKILTDVNAEQTSVFDVSNLLNPSDQLPLSETNLLKETFATKKNDSYVITSRKYPYVRCTVSSNIILNNDTTYNTNPSPSSSSSLPTSDDTNTHKITDDHIICNIDEHLNRFWYYRNKIIFLMVSRKFSLGFIEFVRGRYDISDAKSIIGLFEQMTLNEIIYIHKHDYDDILYYFLNRKNESREIVLNRIYEGKYSLEYCESKIKFNTLKSPSDFPDSDVAWGLHFYTTNVKPRWEQVEWGFPKGRREKRTEENIVCACREFEEETGYTKDQYVVLNKIEPLEENMIGTNGIKYRHIYYLALDLTTDTDADNNLTPEGNDREYDRYEIGDIMWMIYDDCMSHIRPYHMEKKNILTKVYLFLLNYLIHNNVLME